MHIKAKGMAQFDIFHVLLKKYFDPSLERSWNELFGTQMDSEEIEVLGISYLL